MTTYNTGNPLGSTDPRDLYDNAENLDEAVNSDEDTFQDRLGKSRLTWTGVMKAGSGDPAIAVDAAARAEAAAAQVQQDADQIAADAAQQAVTDVVIAVDGAVGRAEDAASRSETARDAAFVNADVYPDVTSGLAAVANGDQFQVVEGDEIVRYRKDGVSTQTEVARYPSAEKVEILESVGGSLVTSTKNLFNPRAITQGKFYRRDGTELYNTNARVSEGHVIAEGQQVTISGIDWEPGHNSVPRAMHFWDANGDLIRSVTLPDRRLKVDHITETAPVGAATFSVNLPWATEPIPEMQFELSPHPTAYEPHLRFGGIPSRREMYESRYVLNENNLFDGTVIPSASVGISAVQFDSRHDRSIAIVPVEFGKTYVISGLSTTSISAKENRRVAGIRTNRALPATLVKQYPSYDGGIDYVVTIDDPEIEFLAFQLSHNAGEGGYEGALKQQIQVEEGTVSTPYMPRYVLKDSEWIVKELREAQGGGGSPTPPTAAKAHVGELVEMDKVLESQPIELQPFTKGFGPTGVARIIAGDVSDNAVGNNLFCKITDVPPGEATLAAMIRCRVDGVTVEPKIKPKRIDVPSGALDNPDTIPGYVGRYPLDNYIHPAIDYSSTPVAGYTHWMIASIHPGFTTGGATWEDEDILVSNDGETWLRIQSLYESDKSYGAPGLRLPPHDFATDARKNSFLPCPARGDVVEISVPAQHGNPEMDRVDITIAGNPWKHDPAILIDGGYVYLYTTYLLPYDDVPGNNNKFIVCIRTANGVDWEVVRSDGSTFPLDTPQAARQMFTKDAQGRFNYLLNPSFNSTNPEVIKYGDGDYEFIYGTNFNRRFKGTTPYNFDFDVEYPFQSKGSGHHPGLLYTGSELLMVNASKFFRSEDRGETFEELPYYPLWVGSVNGLTYKKSMCMGPNGTVLLADSKYITMSGQGGHPSLDGPHIPQHRYCTATLTAYDSVSELMDFAQNGIQDAYIDVQVDIINNDYNTRTSLFRNYIGHPNSLTGNNNAHQLVRLFDYTAREGDVLYMYITLTARGDSSVSLNGVEVH